MTPPAATAYTITAPQGIPLPPEIVKQFAEQAEAAGVKQEDAQKLLDRLVPATLENEQAKRQQAVARFEAALAQDPRFGGASNATNVKSAIDHALTHAGTPALRELLTKAGLDTDPDMQHLIYQAGLAMRPDGSPVRGTKPAANPEMRDGIMTNRAAANRMPYSSMK